ncbi:DNA replication protein [Pasteurella multocida]|uniref:DNA replication protein n=1 Tax=Pasteurella multocida TaxID=747 RepID=UPI0009F71C99|nr:DNA replication protein [Pasteurella multocida]MEB3450919.1 DNA replication protein [Pasteurella multocida]MEB3452668.1 DNA replication protein [Pasteurella multocida]MEB3455096.1 DNA replication protein [Pasteurella multocida]MEB3460559.1 DNA replication protein [Pasteurella multocida]MEB3462404.1 DNA replication protein [Pasteurella multocida]
MRASDILKQTGRSIAYRPALAKLFGGVTAEIFFEQIFYWQDKAENQELGVYKTQAELEEETGLSRKEQETARKKLREIGVLIETHKRLEHRIYFKIDMEKLDEVLSTLADVQSEHSRMPESDIGDSPKGTFVNTLDYNTRLHTNNNPLSLADENVNLAEKNKNTLSANADGERNAKEDLSAKNKKNRSAEKIDYQGVIDAFNEANTENGSRLPFVRELSDKRKTSIKKFLLSLKEPTAECACNYFNALFSMLRPFHFGEEKNSTWKANFDWAIRAETVIKVREENL